MGFWAKDSESLYRLALIVAGLIGIPLLYSRTRSANRSARAALEQAKVAVDQAKTVAERHDEQTTADRERRITESFAKAGEQLGNDKLETRLVGIYTLERISQESEREYWPIMEILTAYVREHARQPRWQLQGSSAGETAGESPPAEQPANEVGRASIQVRPATDIQAILTVLGRRGEQVRRQDEAAERRIDLAGTDLRGANLIKMHLERAKLSEAHLAGADLSGAHLEDAGLDRTRLEGADLRGAYLQGASLGRAHLAGADLRGAYLQDASLVRANLGGATLWEVNLAGADLRGAQLKNAGLGRARLEGATLGAVHVPGALGVEDAKGLTQDQVNSAHGDEATTLPEGLTRPTHWPAATQDNPRSPS